MPVEYIYLHTHGALIVNKYFAIDGNTTIIQPACCGNPSWSTGSYENNSTNILNIHDALYNSKDPDTINKLNRITTTEGKVFLVNTNTLLCDMYLSPINPIDIGVPTKIVLFDDMTEKNVYDRYRYLPYIHNNDDKSYEKFSNLIYIDNILPEYLSDDKYDLNKYPIRKNNLSYDKYNQVTSNLFKNFIQNILNDIFCKIYSEETHDLSYINVLTEDKLKFDISNFPFERLFKQSSISPLKSIKSNMDLYTAYYLLLNELFNNKHLLGKIIQYAGLPKINSFNYDINYQIVIGNEVKQIHTNLNNISIKNDNDYLIKGNPLINDYILSFYNTKDLSIDDKDLLIDYIYLINQIFYKLNYSYLLYCTFNNLLEKEYLIWCEISPMENGFYTLSDVIKAINTIYHDSENVILVQACQVVNDTDDMCEIRSCIVRASGLYEKIEATKISKDDLLQELKTLRDTQEYNAFFKETIVKSQDEFLNDDDMILINFIINYNNLTHDKTPFIEQLTQCVHHIISYMKIFPRHKKDTNCLVVNAVHILNELKLIKK